MPAVLTTVRRWSPRPEISVGALHPATGNTVDMATPFSVDHPVRLDHIQARNSSHSSSGRVEFTSTSQEIQNPKPSIRSHPEGWWEATTPCASHVRPFNSVVLFCNKSGQNKIPATFGPDSWSKFPGSIMERLEGSPSASAF